MPTAFEVTGSSVAGWLKYAAGDVGYNVWHAHDYKVGPFVGYSYFHQTMNAFGCVQLTTPESVCSTPIPANQTIITQDDTWQALRVGVSAVATVWDRLGDQRRCGLLAVCSVQRSRYPLAAESGRLLPAGRHRTRRASRAHPDLSHHRKSQCRHRRTLLGLLEHERQSELPWRLRPDRAGGKLLDDPAFPFYDQYPTLRHVRPSELPVRFGSLA